MIHNGTDWNRHNGVGATLLENWVEERAVGANVITKERNDMGNLNKFGHGEILTHKKGEHTYQTTQKDAYKYISKHDPHQHHIGKRRAQLEAELMKKAMEEVKEPPIDRSAADWVSTTHSDFAHEDYYGRIPDLGEIPPTEEELQRFKHPITFWTDHATKGQGTVICSTNATELVQRSEVVQQLDALKFGRHAAFTTPIQEYKKGPTKTE